jgi:uncharacterized protein (TIGR00251 family)
MSIILELSVNPKSGRQKLSIDTSGRIKCHLKSAPEGGKANAELIAFISSSLRLPKASVMIISGETARHKRIKIETSLDKGAILQKLGLDHQTTL